MKNFLAFFIFSALSINAFAKPSYDKSPAVKGLVCEGHGYSNCYGGFEFDVKILLNLSQASRPVSGSWGLRSANINHNIYSYTELTRLTGVVTPTRISIDNDFLPELAIGDRFHAKCTTQFHQSVPVDFM